MWNYRSFCQWFPLAATSIVQTDNALSTYISVNNSKGNKQFKQKLWFFNVCLNMHISPLASTGFPGAKKNPLTYKSKTSTSLLAIYLTSLLSISLLKRPILKITWPAVMKERKPAIWNSCNIFFWSHPIC